MKTPYRAMEYWICSYEGWKKELEECRNQLESIAGQTAHLELVLAHGKGQTSDPVFREVARRIKCRELERVLLSRIRMIGTAMLALDEEERRFIELRYWQQCAPPVVMHALKWSRRTFFRKRNHILARMYRIMGGEEVRELFPEPDKHEDETPFLMSTEKEHDGR